MRMAGILASGESVSGQEATDAFNTFKMIVRSWASNGLLMPTEDYYSSFSLTSGQAQYSLGDDGSTDWDVSQTIFPADFTALNLKINNVEYPIEIINSQQIADVRNKSIQGRPSMVFIRPYNTYYVFEFFPKPDQSYNLNIYFKGALDKINSISNAVYYPDGYDRALMYELYVELCQEYGRPVDQVAFAKAQELKAEIMRKNTKPVYLTSDLENKKPFDINKGQ